MHGSKRCGTSASRCSISSSGKTRRSCGTPPTILTRPARIVIAATGTPARRPSSILDSIAASLRPTPRLPFAGRRWIGADTRRHIVGELTGAEFNDADLGQTAGHERIVADDRLDGVPARPGGDDDAAIARDLASGHQERAAGVMLL